MLRKYGFTIDNVIATLKLRLSSVNPRFIEALRHRELDGAVETCVSKERLLAKIRFSRLNRTVTRFFARTYHARAQD